MSAARTAVLLSSAPVSALSRVCDSASLDSDGCAPSRDKSLVASSGPEKTSTFELAICTWICGVRHCGQNGRPSSTGVPHCEHACSTHLKLAQSAEHGKALGDRDTWSSRHLPVKLQDHAMARWPDHPMPSDGVILAGVDAHIHQRKARAMAAGFHRHDVLISLGPYF